MSNILVIKHGSLGDIVQISGVLKDIRDNYTNGEKIFILTTAPYVELLSKCPFVDRILIDRRLPRWNFLYLVKLRNMIKKFQFSTVFDLQNSSRTSFYRKYLFKIDDWSSARTKIKKDKNFKNDSVLERFKLQLENSNIKTMYTLKPDFSWACSNIGQIINKFFGGKFILLFPFCSPQLPHKKWPYYNELIKIIKSKHENINIAIAPGPNEIDDAKKINATTIVNYNKPLNMSELAGLVKKSSFVISNDTGPAHIAAHLGKHGLVLFGYHTTPSKVSIETENFKPIVVKDLNQLSAEDVYLKFKSKIELIN